MSKWMKIGIIAAAVVLTGVIALGTAGAVALAQTGIGFERGGPADFFRGEGAGPLGHRGGPGRGVGGQVTAIDGETLTVEDRNGETVTVNVTEDTRVMLTETQSEGSLSDISVGSNIGVRGQRNDDGTVEAVDVVVMPAGDMAGGRVTAVEDNVITVEDRDGETTRIVTGEETTFRVNRDEAGALEDVTVGMGIGAFGETQDDGSLAARLVMVGPPGKDGGPHPNGPDRRGGERGPREGDAAGEVTAIDGSSFTLDSFFDDTTVTVQTDENTTYRTRSGDDLSFDDIEVGNMVMVRGQPVAGEENTIRAEVIGIKQ